MGIEKARKGEPFKPSTEFQHATVEAIEYARRQQSSGGAGVGRDIANGIPLIQNNSGADRDRLDVLGISGPLITPTADLAKWKNQLVLKGVKPTSSHLGKFAILLEPVKQGKFARAAIAGVCWAKITMSDADHKYADAKDDDAGSLQSGVSGAKIVWVESGTGLKYGYIRFGLGGHQARWIRFVVNDGSGFATTDASVTVDGVTYHDGYEPASAVTTVHNMVKEDSSYVFEGDDNDAGYALYDPDEDKYYIWQMECP